MHVYGDGKVEVVVLGGLGAALQNNAGFYGFFWAFLTAFIVTKKMSVWDIF